MSGSVNEPSAKELSFKANPLPYYVSLLLHYFFIWVGIFLCLFIVGAYWGLPIIIFSIWQIIYILRRGLVFLVPLFPVIRASKDGIMDHRSIRRMVLWQDVQTIVTDTHGGFVLKLKDEVLYPSKYEPPKMPWFLAGSLSFEEEKAEHKRSSEVVIDVKNLLVSPLRAHEQIETMMKFKGFLRE
jgi:hypothetical protein